MKRKLGKVMIAAAVTALVLAGCGNAKTEQPSTAQEASGATEDLLDKVKGKGKITVAMEGTWAPWTYVDESGTLTGFDVDVAAAVAKKLGVEVEYITGEWDGLLAGVQGGRYDIMVNGVGYTEERAQSYTFSDPYAFNKTALVVRGDNNEIASLEDLEGKKTCNSANSTYQLAAEEFGATVEDVETLDGTMEMVLSGRADATLNAEVSIFDYLAQQPDANIKIVDYLDEVEQVCIIMPKGDSSASLQAAINQALNELREDGTIAQLSMKYFNGDISVNE